jgi:hypothetical protein
MTILARIVLFNTLTNTNACFSFTAIGESKECEHYRKNRNDKEDEKVIFFR